MKADAAQPHNYDKYVQLHATVAASNDPDLNPAHRGPAFCPWHRYLLAKFEKDLQHADQLLGNDGTITLPYWDWTNDHASSPNLQRGGMWHDDFMGGNGTPVSGSFSDWTQAPPGGGRLGRQFGINTPTLPRTAEVDRALNAHGFDCPPFAMTSPLGPGLAAPPAPAATGAAGGTLPAGEYRVATTYVNAPNPGTEGETRASPEAIVCLGAGCAPSNANAAISVPSPPAQAGAIGYRTYVSTANGASTTMTRQGATTAIGTTTTITTLASGPGAVPTPTINTTTSFRNLLEGWASARGESETHNRGHVWVGGSMLPETSPNDPVFFLHHCNVDRLWALWQLRHPGQNYPVVVPRLAGAGNRPEGLNDPMPPWTSAPELVRPIDVLNHTSITINGQAMGYTYDTDPPGVAVDVSP